MLRLFKLHYKKFIFIFAWAVVMFFMQLGAFNLPETSTFNSMSVLSLPIFIWIMAGFIDLLMFPEYCIAAGISRRQIIGFKYAQRGIFYALALASTLFAALASVWSVSGQFYMLVCFIYCLFILRDCVIKPLGLLVAKTGKPAFALGAAGAFAAMGLFFLSSFLLDKEPQEMESIVPLLFYIFAALTVIAIPASLMLSFKFVKRKDY